MKASVRRLSLAVFGLGAAGFVLGCLSVEVVTRANVARAQRALPGALARLGAAPDLSEADRRTLREAQAFTRDRAFARVAQTLETRPGGATAALHTALQQAWLAADEGAAAAQNAQFAARIAPEDADLAREADRMVDLALAYRVRPAARIGAGLSALALLVLGILGYAARRRRRALESYLDSVSGRLRFSVDGAPAPYPLRLGPGIEALTLDVFLSGRYGMACPRRPARGPTMHVSCSHAGANETLRLRPVRHVCDSAVRVHMQDHTLRRLLARPGRWRIHVRLGDRIVANATLDVLAPYDAHSDLSRRNGALAL
jgi:hypothetical protein